MERTRGASRREHASARLYAVTVHISEEATDYAFPVITHVFRGRTPEEAWGYHDAHRRADAFLRSCEDRGRFEREVRCRVSTSEGWER